MIQFAVIAPGRVGTGMALALQGAGHRLLGAWARNPDSLWAQRFAALTQAPVFALDDAGHLAQADLLARADLVLVTAPDRAIADLATRLAQSVRLASGAVVAHTCGALPSSVLAPLSAQPVRLLSWHPLQTIAAPEVAPASLRGAFFTLEGDPEAVARAEQWTQDIGGVPRRIAAADRPRYHAAAVMASNYLVALAAVAADVLGGPDGLAALLPLMQGALTNLAQLGLPHALTGPVERNDTATIERHLAALTACPDAIPVYAALGEATARLAVRKGSLTPDDAARLVRQLYAAMPAAGGPSPKAR